MKKRLAVGLALAGIMTVPVAMAVSATQPREGMSAAPVSTAAGVAASLAATSAEMAPLPSPGVGRLRMPDAEYAVLADALGSNGDKANDRVAPRESSVTLLDVVDGRQITAVTSEDGSLCFIGTDDGRSVSAGCSQHLREVGIEPLITTVPAVAGMQARHDQLGLIAADVTAVEVELESGEMHPAAVSKWAYWWTSSDGTDAPTALHIHRGGAVETFDF